MYKCCKWHFWQECPSLGKKSHPCCECGKLGLYGFFFGFFWWGVGEQIVLVGTLCIKKMSFSICLINSCLHLFNLWVSPLYIWQIYFCICCPWLCISITLSTGERYDGVVMTSKVKLFAFQSMNIHIIHVHWSSDRICVISLSFSLF